MIRRASYTVLSSSSCHLRRRLHQTTLLQSAACNLMNTSDVVLPSRSVATSATTLRIMPSTNPNDLAASSPNTIARSKPRLCFSTMAATANNTSSPSSSNESTSSSTNNKKEKDKKDDSNIFLDNLGKIFLSSIGLVLLFLLRSTKSNNSRVALREEMENAALLDPLEIEDLRCANSDFTMEVWNTVVEEIKNEFVARGISSMTYPQFLSLVMRVMKDVKGEGFTVQMGHLMDRVVIAELERRREGNDNAAGHQEGSDELPLSFLLASLSLALNSSVADRIRVLYDSMLIGNEMNNSSSSSSEGQESTNTNTNINDASKEQVEEMIQNLQSTCQLVPDAQIVETNSKVPYQTFRVGTGSELARRAREGYGGKKGSQGVTRDGDGPVTLEDFHAILKSRTVCAWGECYIKKSSRTSTSDR